ncbi:hypothetical protein [Helicobacter apodemus]|uniref:Uncharacterized protein n=1 Tax=Helicobacter apodemus TaxID=135569 RepID=A0A2U8FAU1_9HELI|nr:hypothetical protein [Helicobacter apodemus]AWI33349.1 hypothetical protein CDV25_00205 [Helicobacter apodemus]
MALGSALSESALRNNAMMHYGNKIMIVDTINNGVGIELTQEGLEKIEEYAKMGLYGITKDNAYGKDVYVFKGSMMEELKDFIQDTRYVKETLDLNREGDFKALSQKGGVNFENINAKTNIVFANGIHNTLQDARNSANLIQRGFLNRQVGIVNNATRGFINDVLEYNPNTLSVTDFIIANQIQKLSPNTIYTAHSAANKDINNANFLNATTNTETKYKLISIGSPIAESELRESTNAVGAELVRQVNHPYDPVAGILNSGERERYSKDLGEYVEQIYPRGYTTPTSENTRGIIIHHVEYQHLKKYHPFKSYYNNPEFQLQQTIQRLLMQDAMKEVKEKGLGDDKE